MSTRRGFPEPLPPEKGQGGAFRTVLWETYPHPRGKNGRGHISHVRIQKKPPELLQVRRLQSKTAATYSPTVTQYHRRGEA